MQTLNQSTGGRSRPRRKHEHVPRKPDPRLLELVARYREGDERALREMLTSQGSLLRRVVRIRLLARLRALRSAPRPPAELLLRALRRVHARDPGSASEVLELLAGLTEGWVCDHPGEGPTAERGPRLRFDVPDAWSSAEPARDDPAAARRAEYEELVDRHAEALTPPELRETLLLRDYLGMEWEAIARELRLPDVEQAQVLYRRALEQLRQRLRHHLRQAP